MPTTVNITLTEDLLLTDDGGDFEDEQGVDLADIQVKLQERKRHYKKKLTRYGRGPGGGRRRNTDKINVQNNAAGGQIEVRPLLKEEA